MLITVEFKHTSKHANVVWNNWKKDNYQQYLFMISTNCQTCKSNKKIGIHHIDGDKTNNKSNNHQTLCEKCHFKIHTTFRVKYQQEEKIIKKQEEKPKILTKKQLLEKVHKRISEMKAKGDL